jgi:hypothetical protein
MAASEMSEVSAGLGHVVAFVVALDRRIDAGAARAG